jgi:hypothetical protein
MTTIEAYGPESSFFEATFFSVTGGDGKEEAFSASASPSSSDEDDPSSSDEASSSLVEINVSIGFVPGNPVYNRVVFGSQISTPINNQVGFVLNSFT